MCACISVGVHVTAVLVAAQLGAGAMRRMVAKPEPPVLEVIVTEPKPVVTPPVPLPVAPVVVAPTPAPAAKTALAMSLETKPPEASVAKSVPPKTPPPVAEATIRTAPKPAVVRVAAEPRISASDVSQKPVAPVASPPVAKVAEVVVPRAVVAAVVASQPVAVTTVPAAVTRAAPSEVVGRAVTGRSEEGQGTVSLPQYRSNPAPVYPDSARRQRQEGVVWLAVEVSERGDALTVAVGQSSGHAALDHAAVMAVRGWKFEPARQGARPAVARVEVPVRFRLAN